jgi:hypothetical protein
MDPRIFLLVLVFFFSVLIGVSETMGSFIVSYVEKVEVEARGVEEVDLSNEEEFNDMVVVGCK